MRQQAMNVCTGKMSISSILRLGALALFAGVLALCVSAQMPSSAWADEQAEVPDQSNFLAPMSDDAYSSGAAVNGEHYDNIQTAWSAAYNAAKSEEFVTFELFEDWNIIDTSYWGRTYLGKGDGFVDGHLVTPANSNMQISLHGHMIDRGLAASSGSYSKSGGEVICVGSHAYLFIDGGDTTVAHGGHLIKGTDGVAENVWRPVGSNASSSVTCYGGTITGGYSTDGAGGIKLEANACLYMDGVNLVGNMADYYCGDGDGGALYLQDYGTVHLLSCHVDYNYAQSTGGAVFARGKNCLVSLRDSTMNNNFAYGYNTRGGGAICIDGKCDLLSLELVNSQMDNNYARASGGAIYANTGKLDIQMEYSSMDSNSAKSSVSGRGDGGAIYANEGIALNMYGSTMSNNVSTRKGGAIFADADNCSVEMTAESSMNGNQAPSYGGALYVDNEGLVIRVNDSTVNMNEAKDDGGAFYFNASVKSFSFTDSSLSHNSAKGNYDGGAIYADGTLSASFNNCGINNNSAGHDGGAVYLNGSDSAVKLWKNSTMDLNHAGHDGGAVYMNAFDCVATGNLRNPHNEFAEGGAIRSNSADNCGGAIYINHAGYAVSNLRIANNTAKEGGAVYVTGRYVAKEEAVSGCRIEYNKAQSGAGAIYTRSGKWTLRDCYISNNTCSGDVGGINWTINMWTSGSGDMYTGGKLVIRDNEGSNARTNNLLVDNSHAGVPVTFQCNASNSSEIHFAVTNSSILNGTASDLVISKAGAWHDTPLICENNGYYVSWKSNAYGGDRMLHLVKGSKEEESPIEKKDITLDERYTVAPGGYTEAPDGVVYDLQIGAFNHVAYCNGRAETTNTYYYSDGYFAQPSYGKGSNGSSTSYNAHLATMSLNMAIAAFPAENGSMQEGLDGNQEANRTQYATQLMGDLGFTHIRANENYLAVPTTETIGAIMGYKTISLGPDDEDFTLVIIITRGASYGMEWASNVTLGDEGEAEGFSKAGQTVFDQTVEYVTDMGLGDQLDEGKVKFWLMGYSRGAATANICAKHLVDEYQDVGNEIFAYTFETPAGGCDEEAVPYKVYTGIHNIINTSDLVTKVAPSGMGIVRYGVDHYVPGSPAGEVQYSVEYADHADPVEDVLYTRFYDNVVWPVNGTEYRSQVPLLTEQLKIVDPSIEFDDYFTLANMNLFRNKAVNKATQFVGFTVDLLTESASGNVNFDKYLEVLFDKVLESACDMRIDYTTTFSLKVSATETVSFNSLQDAARTFIVLMRVLPKEQKDGLMSVLSDIPSKFGYYDLYGLYNQANDWNNLSDAEKYVVLSKVWNAAGVSQNGGKCIMDYVPDDMKDDIEDSFYTAVNAALCVYSYDHSHSGSSIFHDDNATSDTLTLLGTFLNLGDATLNHEPDLCLSWVRSYDSFYSGSDNEWSTHKPNFTGPMVAAPSAWSAAADGMLTELDDETTNVLPTGARVVLMDENNTGAILYFELDDQMMRFNERAIPLTDGTHTLVVHSYAFDEYSLDTVTYTIVVGDTAVQAFSVAADAQQAVEDEAAGEGEAEAAVAVGEQEPAEGAPVEGAAIVSTAGENVDATTAPTGEIMLAEGMIAAEAAQGAEKAAATETAAPSARTIYDPSYALRPGEAESQPYVPYVAPADGEEGGMSALNSEPEEDDIAIVETDLDPDSVYWGGEDVVVHLSCDTEGAVISYVLDGADPQVYDPEQGVVLHLDEQEGDGNYGKMFLIVAYAVLDGDFSVPETFCYELTAWGGHVIEGDVVDNGDGTHTFTCAVCSVELDDGGKTQITEEHEWEDGWCPICGHKCEHLNEEGESALEDVVIDPTCTEKGYTVHECSVCASYVSEDSYTECIDHDWKLDDVLSEERGATSEEDAVYVCRMCGEQRVGNPDGSGTEPGTEPGSGGSSPNGAGSATAATGDSTFTIVAVLAIAAVVALVICVVSVRKRRKQ